jgi:hypothetical protein
MITSTDFLKIHKAIDIASDTSVKMDAYVIYVLLFLTDSIIEPDGNAFICHSANDFINLQESDNYAYGDTELEAVINYLKLMLDCKKQ